jgi:hypothetical protein
MSARCELGPSTSPDGTSASSMNRCTGRERKNPVWPRWYHPWELAEKPAPQAWSIPIALGYRGIGALLRPPHTAGGKSNTKICPKAESPS